MGNEATGKVPGNQPVQGAEPRPKRLVLLTNDETSGVSEVLGEYPPAGIKGSELHTALKYLAAEHPGSMVAAEWLGTVGWTRFLWCRTDQPH